MSFKVGFYGGSTGNTESAPAFNALRFSTPGMADDYGHGLLARWTAPTGYAVAETTDPPNAEYIDGVVSYYRNRVSKAEVATAEIEKAPEGKP